MANPSVLTQFVGKSGSHRPTVSLYYDYESDSAQSRTLAADQVMPSPGAVIRPDGNGAAWWGSALRASWGSLTLVGLPMDRHPEPCLSPHHPTKRQSREPHEAPLGAEP